MKKGFTLVEMLVVLVIIAILVAIILPNALKAIDNGNIKQAAADLRNLDTGLKLCYTDNNQDWTKCDSTALLYAKDANGNPLYMEQPNGTGNDPWGSAYTLGGDDTTGWYSVKTTIFPNWPSLAGVVEK